MHGQKAPVFECFQRRMRGRSETGLADESGSHEQHRGAQNNPVNGKRHETVVAHPGHEPRDRAVGDDKCRDESDCRTCANCLRCCHVNLARGDFSRGAGFAELLPISSSAHVVVAEKLMGMDPSSPQMTLLLVMLHTGTMVAVILFFWKQWRRTFFKALRHSKRQLCF